MSAHAAQIQFAFPIAIAKNNKQYNFKFCKEKLTSFNQNLFQAITHAINEEKFTEETFYQLVQQTIKLTYISSATVAKQDKPKKPIYGFMAYCMQHRAEIKEKNPDLKSNQINAILGPMWKKLSDEEKAKYAAPEHIAPAPPAPPAKEETEEKQPKASKKPASKPASKKTASDKPASKPASKKTASDKPSIKEEPSSHQEEQPTKAKQPKEPKAKKEKEPKAKEAKLTKTYEKEIVNEIITKFNSVIAKVADEHYEEEKEAEHARKVACNLFVSATKKAKGSFSTLWTELSALTNHENYSEVMTLFNVEEAQCSHEDWKTDVNYFQNLVLDIINDILLEQIDKHLDEVKEKQSNDMRYYHISGFIHHMQTLGYQGKNIDDFLAEYSG